MILTHWGIMAVGCRVTDMDMLLCQVYVLNPKQNLHGLGYDPFKHAPEFREKKRSRLPGNKELGHRKGFSMKDNLLAFRCLLNSSCLNASAGRTAPGFGIGALEELDAEDEDVYASG
ncbi:SWAP (Suppressor-of-White-APricot)/surp domain-containing protein [Actinidia rufa]|uniref:SWAP (Suppressor-of-White-APricot)/surp domain-containing protein n=1 Tax=Actinidia rufa TaxID=165716 RepID=A0A7J0DR60_9ERIC|nr:SWAP (Suppressor-of-White-APricot)/surp domain-containing protein [Actinidia rufa]